MAASQDEVFSKVQGVLTDALGVDAEEVSPEKTLQGDLGAESIDFLDIVFRLEKAFSIKRILRVNPRTPTLNDIHDIYRAAL